MATPKVKYTVYYFGADKSWEDITKTGANRRNTCLIKALANCSFTSKVFVVRETSLRPWLKWFFFTGVNKEKVNDLYYCTFLSNYLKSKKTERIDYKINRALLAIITWRFSRKTVKVTWAYWPEGFRLSDKFKIKGINIFDSDHNIVDDPNLAPEEKYQQVELLRKAGNNCNYILSSVRSMIEWYNTEGYSNCFRLRNGIDLSRFSHLNKKGSKSSSDITIGYCGILSAWINYDIFSELIKRNPTWKFLIIGSPYKSDGFQKLIAPNVFFTGYKSAEETISLISTFDVALNLYLSNPALDVDSMKLYEYLAAGIPVISTPFHPYLEEDFNNLLNIKTTVVEIETAINELALKGFQTDNIALRSFLDKSTWNRRVSNFFENIS